MSVLGFISLFVLNYFDTLKDINLSVFFVAKRFKIFKTKIDLQEEIAKTALSSFFHWMSGIVAVLFVIFLVVMLFFRHILCLTLEFFFL